MITERFYDRLGPVLLTTDGQENGVVTIDDTACWKVGMAVILYADGKDPQRFKIKKVLNTTDLVLGPEFKGILHRSDMTCYTLAVNSTIEAPCQERPNIPPADYERAVYEEEPTIAKRVFNVDKYGRPYTFDNPFPVTASIPTEYIPVHFEGTVASSGTQEVLSIPGEEIVLAFVFNPNKGPNQNGSNDVLLCTVDETVQKTTVPRGSSRYFPGVMQDFRVDSNTSGTIYEVILWYEVPATP